jgi:hypothetical protein
LFLAQPPLAISAPASHILPSFGFYIGNNVNMTDEQLKIIDEFAKKYAEAPADRPFDKAVVDDILARLTKSGINDCEAKRLLRDAAIPEDHRDFRRSDARASVGDVLSAKELCIIALFC